MINEPTRQGQSVFPFFLLALLSAVAVFDVRKPLSSLRPDQPKPSSSRDVSSQTARLEQRIWSDPFAEQWFYEDQAQSDIIPTLTSKSNRVLFMPIALPDAPRARDRESRTRRRYAVHLALSRAGYRAMHPGALYGVDLNEIRARDPGSSDESMGDDGRMAVELFEVDWLSQAWYENPVKIKGGQADSVTSIISEDDFDYRYDHIVVAYLQSGYVNPDPLNRFVDAMDLLKSLCFVDAASNSGTIDTRIIGPADSGQVYSLLKGLERDSRKAVEAHFPDDPVPPEASAFSDLICRVKKDPELLKRLAEDVEDSYYLFSPIATSDFETLIGQGRPGESARNGFLPTKGVSSRESAETLTVARQILKALTGARYIRTVHDDSTVFEEIVCELKLRGAITEPEDLAKVALIVESDTRYGRAMAVNFLKGAGKVIPVECPDCDVACDDHDTFSSRMRKLKAFTYISGIDGDEEGSQVEEGASDSPKPGSVNSFWAESEKQWKDPVSHGYHQIDYIRRLAEEIAKQSQTDPIRAIGILGVDVYDKLLLMRALEPVLDEVIFFTTDIDARLWYSSEVGTTRNLIIGTSHGLSFNPELQGFVPPFRDTYQSSIFASVLLAANSWGQPYDIDQYTPQIYEIGTRGPVYLRGGSLRDGDLETGDEESQQQEPCEDDDPDSLDLFQKSHEDHVFRIGIGWVVAMVASISIVFTVWYYLRHYLGTGEEGMFRQKHRWMLWIVVAATLIVGISGFVATRSADQSAVEPFYLFAGVSGWLSFFIQLLNTVLAICLCVYIKCTRLVALKRTMKDVEANPPLPEPEKETKFKEAAQYFRKDVSKGVKVFAKAGKGALCFLALNVAGILYGRAMSEAAKSGDLTNQWPWFLAVIIILVVIIAGALYFDWNRGSRLVSHTAKNFAETLCVRGFCLPFLLLSTLTFSWALSSGLNFLPIRGETFAVAFKISQLLQTTAMLTLLSYVACESAWVAKVIDQLCRREKGELVWDPDSILADQESDVKYSIEPEYEAKDRDLKKAARCVQFTARLTEIPNRYLLFPFFVLFLSFLASHTDFDDWAWPQYRWGISLFLFACCLVPAIVMRGSARHLRKRAVEAFSKEESKILFKKPVSGEEGAAADYLQRLNSIRRGAYAPLLSQPFVLAILTPMGGLGSFALIKLLFTNFF